MEDARLRLYAAALGGHLSECAPGGGESREEIEDLLLRVKLSIEEAAEVVAQGLDEGLLVEDAGQLRTTSAPLRDPDKLWVPR